MEKITCLLVALCVLSMSVFAGGGRTRVVENETVIKPAKGQISIDGVLDEWNESDATLLTTAFMGGIAGHGAGAFDKYSAKIAFKYDDKNLYVAIWWKDPTPLGYDMTPGVVPAVDGMVLSVPTHDGVKHLALWKVPGVEEYKALMTIGEEPLSSGEAKSEITQKCLSTGEDTYTQEIQIPWKTLGVNSKNASKLRLGVELCFGGLDPTKGYQAWIEENLKYKTSGNRWGGNIGLGGVDGLKDKNQFKTTYDPNTGAAVKLMESGAKAPANPAVLYRGEELTRTTNMIATPAEKIVVDGVLGDKEWDRESGTLVAFEPSLFPGHYETQIMWAYDDKGLYIGLRWFTMGQQININNPSLINRGYDGGDAVQIRLATDKVSHIDAWCYTPAWKPAMNITYGAQFNEGKIENAMKEGVEMAFQPNPTGGYAQEIFIPWKLITKTGKALKKGDQFRVVLDLFYSGVEQNRFPYILNSKIEESTGVIDIPFVAPKDGFYTIVIEDGDKNVVRRLLAHEKLKKGQVISSWDGLNDKGEPVPSGTYAFRGLYHDGLGLKYLTTFNNPGSPSWQTDEGNGEWGGDHCAPQAVATDENGVYLGWAAAEDGSGIIGLDFNGKKKWGFFQTPHPTGCGAALLASDGDTLFFASDILKRAGRSRQKGEKATAYFETIIAAMDPKTGFSAEFSKDKPYIKVDEFNTSQIFMGWWWNIWKDKSFSLDNSGIRDDYYFSGHVAGSNLTGIVAKDKKLYLSLRLSQQIAVYDAKTMKEITRWSVAKPAGLAFSKQGKLLAISGEQIVSVDLSTGKTTPIVTSNLEAPVGIAIDDTGKIYASDWATAQCVKVFSPEGKFLKTIGAPGGRNWIGAFQPNGMLLPRQIAIDKQNRLWVAENDNFPRCVSVWDIRSGKLLKQFIGGTTYGAVQGGMIDPDHPDHAISQQVMYKIDLTKEGYAPLSTLSRRTSLDDYFQLDMSIGAFCKFIDSHGKRYVATMSRGAIVVGELHDDCTWTPRAAVGGVFNRTDNSQVVPLNKLEWRMTPAPETFRKHAGYNYIWTDLNGDGHLQEDELSWKKQNKEFPLLQVHWGAGGVDDQLDIMMGGWLGGKGIFRFPLKSVTENGAPVYSFDDYEKMIEFSFSRPGSVAVDGKGRVYINEFGEWRLRKGVDTHITAYDTDGSVRWKYPTHADNRPMGQVCGEKILGPIDAGGELGDIFTLSQWHGCFMPILTTDGLFVGRVLRDPAEGGKPGPDMYRGETIQFLNKLNDGRIILSHGKNAHHLMEVTGLDKVKRFGGTFALTDDKVKLATEKLKTRKKADDANAPIRIVNSKVPVAIDGVLDEWDMKTASDIGDSNAVPSGTVMMRSDGKKLYVAYQIKKKGTFLNTGDNPKQLFLSGDAVDLQFCSGKGTDPKRKEVVMGDRRLLISKYKEEPIAVFYDVKVPGVKKPEAFSSPTRSVYFDNVRIIKDAKIAIKDKSDGYIVEAAIPLKPYILDDFLWPGRIFQGDAGFIVGDSTGRRTARIYRFNKDTGVISDIPTEAALTPKNWGEIEVDNPKK